MKATIINADKVLDSAYNLGQATFEYYDTDVEGIESFHDTAMYSNQVLPKIRRLSGFTDNGKGTYQVNQTVLLIENIDLKKCAIEPIVTDSATFCHDVYDAWLDGAHSTLH